MKQYQMHCDQTLDTLIRLMQQGTRRQVVILRHSEKRLTRLPGMEPFMPLTDKGKSFAFKFGQGLSTQFSLKLFSSTFGRCIETAYLIDKGFSENHTKRVKPATVSRLLTPFYVSNIKEVSARVESIGSDTFIRQWFDGRFSSEMILDPMTTAGTLCHYLKSLLDSLEDDEIGICVSHDWNLFPLKQFLLDQPFDEYGDVGYLEGVILYPEKDQLLMTNHLNRPVEISIPELPVKQIEEL
ncbi:MAG: histidine phosphatase family protein [Desulfobacteraceae bacterium]|nr:MAG: histidine phosphatase family protein [Desulfobacteraceae bacterium]